MITFTNSISHIKRDIFEEFQKFLFDTHANVSRNLLVNILKKFSAYHPEIISLDDKPVVTTEQELASYIVKNIRVLDEFANDLHEFVKKWLKNSYDVLTFATFESANKPKRENMMIAHEVIPNTKRTRTPRAPPSALTKSGAFMTIMDANTCTISFLG